MAELLLNSSADPSVLDISRLNETMTKVVRRELSVLDSSDNENNDDDSTSPLSPLTSENDYEHDEEKSQDKQLLHVESTDLPDRNPSPRTTSASTPQKKVNLTNVLPDDHLRILGSRIEVFANVPLNRQIRLRKVKLVRPVETMSLHHQLQCWAKIRMTSKVKKKEKYVNRPMK